MIKKLITILFFVFLIQQINYAKDVLEFYFPNEGWHKVESPDGIKTKKCYVPFNQSSESYTEMIIFSERILKHEGLNALVMLNKQLGKDKNNYKDIVPQYVYRDENNAMAIWCSKAANTCTVNRAFQGKEGVVFVSYINKMPHYSQNMFGQWSNILAGVKVYEETETQETKSLIELD